MEKCSSFFIPSLFSCFVSCSLSFALSLFLWCVCVLGVGLHVCDTYNGRYLGGGDLFFHLTRRVDAAPEDAASGAGFSEQESRVLLAEITLGLEHMHAHNFIHCDIKVSL